MKCPNCGAKIPEDNLYCEKCGAEIQIVPDFEFDEFDIENQMNETMSDISTTEFANEYDIEFDEDPNYISMLLGKHKSGAFFYVVVALVLVVIVFAAVFVGKRISRQNSFEYQMTLAEEKLQNNNVEGAITCYENAYKLKKDPSVLFTIANIYYSIGRDNDAIYTLSEVTNGDFTKEEIIEAYEKIVSLYMASENYEMIANFLKDCTEDTIISRYADFCVVTPSLSLASGTYTDTQALKMSAEGSGRIYYTVDGSTPSEKSTLFTSPIFLEYGSYTINAVYINDYGVASDVVTGNYLIDVDFVFEPTILTEEGTYTEATLVEAEVPVLYTLYYTTDGSEPSKDSSRYVAPIPLKEGETTFKFIMYASDGTQSTIVEKTYKLELEAQNTPAEAVTALGERLKATGYILPDGCHKEGEEGKFLFMYSAIYPIEGMGNFYFVVEYLEDEDGNRSNTGNIFAVNCNDLSTYIVTTIAAGEYSLTAY